MELFDYCDGRGNDIARATRGLQKKERAKLARKFVALETHGQDELYPGLVSGPLRGARHIYEIKINGPVAVRPLLCKGPQNMNQEYTILIIAQERDNQLVPSDAPQIAENRRQEIITNPQRRVRHERIA